MKWPHNLVLVRHGESAYNQLKRTMGSDPDYRNFVDSFSRHGITDETSRQAEQLHASFPALFSDIDTPLTDAGRHASRRKGRELRGRMDLPDIVYVSPYRRTWETLACLADGWPELGHVRALEDDRLREQEFGQRLLYSDWRFFFALHPSQMDLLKIQGHYWYRYPQGENIPDVRARSRSWMSTLTRDYAGRNVLAVSHHLAILGIVANMKRLDAASFMEMDARRRPLNAGSTEFMCQGDGSFTLCRYNGESF